MFVRIIPCLSACLYLCNCMRNCMRNCVWQACSPAPWSGRPTHTYRPASAASGGRPGYCGARPRDTGVGSHATVCRRWDWILLLSYSCTGKYLYVCMCVCVRGDAAGLPPAFQAAGGGLPPPGGCYSMSLWHACVYLCVYLCMLSSCELLEGLTN